MAPTAAKMQLTLRMDGESAAGAGAGGPEAEKRQKTGSGSYKVSNNFARRSARGASDPAKGSTSPSLVPSDDDEAAAGAKPSAKLTYDKDDDEEALTDDGDKKPAAKSDDGKAMDVDDDDDDDEYDYGVLPHGMQLLAEQAEVPGTVAAYLVGAAEKWYGANDVASVEKFGDVVAALRDEGNALDFVLDPENAGLTFLARIKGNRHFSLLHGIQRWPARKAASVLDGRVVAFEGEIDGEDDAPAMLHFRGNDAELFQLVELERIQPRLFSSFYHGKDLLKEDGRDTKFFDYGRRATSGEYVSRLTPIPLMWAPFFLDEPNMGTTFRRVLDLIRGVDRAHRHLFELLLRGVSYACLQDESVEEAALATEWKRVPRTKQGRETISRLWVQTQVGEDMAPADLSSAPEDLPDLGFNSLFDGDARGVPGFATLHRAAASARAPAKAATAPGRNAVDDPAERTTRPRNRRPATPPPARRAPRASEPPAGGGLNLGTLPGADMAAVITAIIRSQNENQLAIAAASNASMIAFHTATAQALAAKAGDKDSKLTAMKKRILQACSGQADSSLFVPPQVYQEMEIEGSSTEAVGRILRSLLQPRTRSIHNPNVYVTPQLLQTVKSMAFSANNDKTYAGCTKGITIFATPWRSIEAMNEDALEEACFEASTHKSVADIRKHIAGIKVELPSDLLMLIRMFNNYIKLLEVLFGPLCPHLLQVQGLRDGLEENEGDLETRMTTTLCLHLLWRVHQDARSFFQACERWVCGDPLPRSTLEATARRLRDDCCIDAAMTCPVASFIGPEQVKPKAKAATEGKAGRSKQPTTNPAIPPGCRKAVEAFNTRHPTMLLANLLKRGNITFKDISVGNRGECTSFGLFGRCSAACPYTHAVCTPTAERQVAISAAITKAMAAIARSGADS
jgi:hypothetical protein